jgi:hypothetical protein
MIGDDRGCSARECAVDVTAPRCMGIGSIGAAGAVRHCWDVRFAIGFG